MDDNTQPARVGEATQQRYSRRLQSDHKATIQNLDLRNSATSYNHRIVEFNSIYPKVRR